MSETVSASRVRPAVRRLAIIAFVILVPIAAHSLWDYIELRRLVREIESIRAKGEPVSETLDYPSPPPAPSGTPDAAGYYLAGAMLALEAEASPVITPVQEWFAAPAPDPKVLRDLNVPLGQLVAGTRDAVALADKAAVLPFGRFPGGTEFSYRASGMAHLWSLLTARTLQLSAAGDGDAAVESVLSSLKLRGALREGRWFSFPEDRQVAAVLSVTHPSAASLQKLSEALVVEDQPEARVKNYLQERGRYIGMIWRRYYGSDPNAPRQYSLPMRGLTEMVMRPWFTHQTVDMLQVWAELADAAKTPWPKRSEAAAEVVARYRSTDRERGTPGFGWLSPRSVAVEAFRQAVDATSLIVDRSSRVAVAIERRLCDHADSLVLGDRSRRAGPNLRAAHQRDGRIGAVEAAIHEAVEGADGR